MNVDLHEHLAEEYAGPYNPNVWPGWVSDRIKVDDQDDRDADCHFCKISIAVSETIEEQFQLNLTNTPMTDDLRRLITGHGGEVHGGRLETNASVPLTVEETAYIRELAEEYRNTVGPDASYWNPNWKWVCRRTAKSLDRLANELTTYRHYFPPTYSD